MRGKWLVTCQCGSASGSQEQQFRLNCLGAFFDELSIFTVYPGRLQKYPLDLLCTRNIGDGECVDFKDKVVVHSSN